MDHIDTVCIELDQDMVTNIINIKCEQHVKLNS